VAIIFKRILKNEINLFFSKDFQLSNYNVHEIGGALKKYLRISQSPAIPIECGGNLVACHDGFNVSKDQLINEVSSMPENSKKVLSLIICFLARLAEDSSKTLMGLENLAIIFGPALFGDANPVSNDIAKFTTISSIISTMILHASEIFPVSGLILFGIPNLYSYVTTGG
jgi:hypothetical protein